MTGSVENRKSEGVMVTLERVTALSNLYAGDMVALQTVTGRQDSICSLALDATGVISASALIGYHFVGVLDEDFSAGAGLTGRQTVNVWTKGVFKFRCDSGITTAAAYIGCPVWAATTSGRNIFVTTPGQTADAPIGTLVSRPLQDGPTARSFTGQAWVDVKINPAVWRWTKLYRMTTTTATQACGFCFPPVSQP